MPSTHSVPQLLTFQQAADLLRISKRQFQRLVAQGDIPRVQVGHMPRISSAALAAYIAAHTRIG